MPETRIRRCSLVVLVLQVLWLGGSIAGSQMEPYLGFFGALLQVVLAGLATGIAVGFWLVARPRGRTLGWVLLMPVAGALSSVAAFALMATFRWGC